MKKITAIAWIITMMMTLVASPAFATDWGSENVTMQVGETKTLYLPSYIISKSLKSVNFYSASYNVVEVVSHTNYSVRVKALKATSTPVIVRCDYYYYINNGGYIYQNGGAYDFKITVEGETIVKPTKITLPSYISLEVGETQDIVPTVTPSNAEYTLTWSISDASIATVYNNGMITGKSVGYADLKVKADNGVYAMSRVSVYKPTPSSISIKSSHSMSVGDTYTLSPTVYPTNSRYTLTWTSSDTSVATVSSSGMVTAKSTGKANITVKTDNGKSATCSVTVSAKEVTSVSIKSSLSLDVGDSYTLTPTITPSDAKTSYTWSSDNSGVAAVSQYGVVTAKSAGTARITVKTTNGKSATCLVTVSAKVKLSKTKAIIEKGKTLTLKATVTPSNLPDKSVTWKSSNTKVATVTSAGKVKGVKTGTATITCTSNSTGAKATCKVTVGSVKLDKTEATILKGKTLTLTATVTPSNLPDKSVTWKSSNTKIVTVTSAGKVKGVKTGTATITCTSNATGLKATCKVTVIKSTVTLNKTEACVQKDKTMTLKATVTPSDLADKRVTWESSDTKIATVTSAGKVKGVKYGTATITCTSIATGAKATCQVTVGKVVINMTEFTLKKSRAVTLVATIYPTTLTDKSMTWKSSDPSIATVNAEGKVKGIKAGKATITCTSVATGLKGTCTVTVLSTSEARSMIGDDDELTGIMELESPAIPEPFDVYDLSGRKVLHQVTSLDGLPDGIYIVNGKKILKKK
ncbi:MAG: Ig-like domain-containing protein [Prevotella sp.]|nr:Ig-like domain-containing protein [Prevotella sp.]